MMYCNFEMLANVSDSSTRGRLNSSVLNLLLFSSCSLSVNSGGIQWGDMGGLDLNCVSNPAICMQTHIHM